MPSKALSLKSVLPDQVWFCAQGGWHWVPAVPSTFCIQNQLKNRTAASSFKPVLTHTPAQVSPMISALCPALYRPLESGHSESLTLAAWSTLLSVESATVYRVLCFLLCYRILKPFSDVYKAVLVASGNEYRTSSSEKILVGSVEGQARNWFSTIQVIGKSINVPRKKSLLQWT